MIYNKYVPLTTDDIIGNESIKAKINHWEITEFPHSIMFKGDRGTGKTSAGKMIASLIPNCKLEVVNAGSENGIDKAREIAKNISSIPIGYSSKLILLDESHKGTTGFFTALLNATENTPKNVYIVIATTEPEKVPKDIRSRFVELQTVVPKEKEMLERLQSICDKEGIITEKKVLQKICRKYKNIPRDCITDLDLLIGIDDIDVQLTLLDENGVDDSSAGYKIAKELNGRKRWGEIKSLLKDIKEGDVEGVRMVINSYTVNTMLGNSNKASDCSMILLSFKDEFSRPMKAGLVLSCYENCGGVS